MPKGQQRGNKEAKKPKKAPATPAIPVVPGRAAPAVKSAPPRWPQK